MILEHADIFEAGITLQVLDAVRSQQQKLLDFSIAGIPQLPVMTKILHQHFMCAHRRHAIVDAVTATQWLAFNAIQRGGMDHSARRPRTAAWCRHVGNQLYSGGRVRAKPAKGFNARSAVWHVVTDNDPRTGNGIFSQFHGLKENIGAPNRQL